MARTKQIDKAIALLEDREFCVLTGAGMSTDSGIPDYRGLGTAPRKPLDYGPFTKDEEYRKDFWIDGYPDWKEFSQAKPNAGHVIVSELQSAGFVNGVITQNVDNLHWVGAEQVVAELHGNMYTTSCLACKQLYATAYVINELELGNPSIVDGKVDRENFWVPKCWTCGGILKPDVVFFGENLPADQFGLAAEIAHDAQAMVIAGTSLNVGTPLTFVAMMKEAGKPIIVINKGKTRVDKLADVKLNMNIAEAFGIIASKLMNPVYI
jgi:NAD-dependent SIR2 family protein deacetylase